MNSETTSRDSRKSIPARRLKNKTRCFRTLCFGGQSDIELSLGATKPHWCAMGGTQFFRLSGALCEAVQAESLEREEHSSIPIARCAPPRGRGVSLNQRGMCKPARLKIGEADRPRSASAHRDVAAQGVKRVS